MLRLRIRKIFAWSVKTIAILLAFFALAISLSQKPLLINQSSASKAIYDSAGKLLRLSLSSDEKYRLWTALEKISPDFIEASLLYEDKYFYRHFGVNPVSLVRAFISTFILKDGRTGASTISMQLSRLRFAINSRTVFGKLEQIFRALQLEYHYSKKEILEAYLNLAPYGANIEGVGAAARVYFHKSPSELSPLEALTLAVIPQNPSGRKPQLQGATSSLLAARQRLFSRWLQSHPEHSHLLAELNLPFYADNRSNLPFFAPHLADFLLPTQKDHEIHTTLDSKLQGLGEKLVSNFVQTSGPRGIRNAALILVNWQSMQVLSYIGSADYWNRGIQGQVDGTRGRRSPGSALKPFLYALALDEGDIHPESILKDTPVSFAAYDPENFDRTFVGPISATFSLIRSRNVPAIQLGNDLAKGNFYSFLKRAGIKNLRDEDFYGLALTLGGVEVSLQELVRLYAMLARGGELAALRFTLDNVKNIDSKSEQQVPIRLLSPESGFLVLEMLSKNPPPDADGYVEEYRGFPISWKTGTSFGFRDAWAVGVFGEYVLGVWVGDFEGRSNPAFVGRESAGRLFFNYLDAIALQRGVSSKQRSPGGLHLKRVDVCSVSGALPGPHCKRTHATWFIPGVSPIKPCSVHQEVHIDEETGLRACPGQESGIRPAVFEVWPSDLLHLFQSAGLPRKVPPPYASACKGTETQGFAPKITSPERGISYQFRLAHLDDDLLQPKPAALVRGREPIPLQVFADGGTETIYWFIDDTLVGQGAPTDTLFWNPQPGNFVVRAVDNQGRSDSRELKVEAVE